jgi:hypothetical protein
VIDIRLRPMGRNAAIDWLPHYREVLVATAVRALRDSLPAVHRFTPAAERRAWLSASRDEGGWRAVAVAAGAVASSPVLR